jgi:hypothetical protein
MFPTVAVKEALLWPALTETLAGTVMFVLLLESDTDVEASAGPLRVTVHDADPGALIAAGVHEIPLNAGGTGCAIAIDPSDPDAGIGKPLGSVAMTPVI